MPCMARSRSWWAGLVVVVVALMLSQTQTVTAQGSARQLIYQLQQQIADLDQQVDTLTQLLTTLYQQVTQDESALQQQIDPLQPQIDALQEQVTAFKPASQALAVYDANDKQVGYLIDIRGGIDGPVSVAFRVGERVMPLVVTRFAIGGEGPNNDIWFETTDCTGPPFANEPGSMFPRAIVAKPGHTVYVADFAPGQLITIRSYLANIAQPPPE